MPRLTKYFLCILVAWSVFTPLALGQHLPDVAFAGFAFAGAESTIGSRYPQSQRYEQSRASTETSLSQSLQRRLDALPPQHLRVVPQIESLKGRDQAVAVSLVVNAETISVEQFGGAHKLMALIRAQAMFFDFKSMNVLRSYPISFAYVDTLSHAPTSDEIQDAVRLVYEGTSGKPGILERFARAVAGARLPQTVPRYLQVTSVLFKAEALESLPGYLSTDSSAAQSWAADLVSEAISTRAGVPIVPFAKGYAIGNVMSMRVSDGTIFELKLPTPDYEIKVELSGFRKVKYSEVQGGATAFVYGAYAHIHIEEPLSHKVYLSTALKNGETRVIPASQQRVDDFPHQYDALNGLFVKLATAIGGEGDEKWVRSAASAKDIDQQIVSTKELMLQCK